MNLDKIIDFLGPISVLNNKGLNNIEIKGVSYDSRKIKPGDIFVCIAGEKSDGHNYIEQSEKNGAAAVIIQQDIKNIDIPIIKVNDTKHALSQISSIINDFPSSKLNLIGVTGTNGKTTVTHLIQNMFEYSQKACGLIGTLGHKFESAEKYQGSNYTTPQSPELQQVLKTMVDKNIKNTVMEVSSHALDLKRVSGCNFNAAILTNLTQDHLDYHITMENYFLAKSLLFESLSDNNEKNNKYAVINNDDEYADKFKNKINKSIKLITYGINKKADFFAYNIQFSTTGATFECKTPAGNKKINLKMTGAFSVYNSLAALAAGYAEKLDLDICIKSLEETKSVAGRFETVIDNPLTIIDYAHTPDGLLNILNAAKKIVPSGGKLVCIIGCGGDRDATKRPQMGKIADTLADKVYITSDNPRSEDPQQIITDILAGIKTLESNKIIVEIDRKSSIETAIRDADNKDVIVIAGKGHEDYQILKDKTIHFDDKEEALKAFEKYRK